MSPIPEEPFVSVIVPCRNERPHIRLFLEALLDLDYPREKLEVKIIDGLSSDGTKEIVLEAQRRYPFIRVLDNPKMIVPVAMNMGIRESSGEVVMRLDAHSQYPPDYVRRCIKLLRDNPEAGNAGGRVVNVPNGDGPWARAVAFVTQHPFGVGNSAWRTGIGQAFVDTVPLGTFSRAVLEKVGCFDERLTRGQDHELNARIRRAGYKVAFDPTIQIRYWNQGTLRGLLRQGFYTSMWNVYNLTLHPYTWRWRRFVPACFVFYLSLLIAGAPLWLYPPLGAYLVLLLGISRRCGPEQGGAWRVAATFALYHVIYGAGTYHGLANLLVGRRGRYLGRPLKR